MPKCKHLSPAPRGPPAPSARARLPAREPPTYHGRMARNGYGLFHFLLDVLLTIITGGFWLIWIFVREMRRRR